MKPLLLMLLLTGCAVGPKQETRTADPPTAGQHAPSGHPAEHAHQDIGLAQASDQSLYQLKSQWQTQEGKPFQLAALAGRPQVLAMIYSSCKNVCPQIIADMKRIQAAVSQPGPARVGFVLVSIDPEVDTPARLAALARKSGLDSHWRLLRGSPDDVLMLANLLGVKYRKIGAHDYAHTNLITVLDRKGEIVHRQEGLGVDPAQAVQALNALSG